MELLQMARRWWRAGRIRVSPREGELLRLRSGDIVECEGRRLEVDSWSFREEPDPAQGGLHAGSGPCWRLQLECREVNSDRPAGERRCTLEIEATGAAELSGFAAPLRILLQVAEQPPRVLEADDLTVWCRQPP